MIRYMKIPLDVLHDKNLYPGSKILYGYIYLFSLKKGYCYASNLYLSKLLNCSSRSVTRFIKNLNDNKNIRIKYTETHNRIIYPIDKDIVNNDLKVDECSLVEDTEYNIEWLIGEDKRDL